MIFRKILCVAGILLLNISGNLCQLDVCGQAPLNNKIVGGVEATTGSWPWQASIRVASSDRHFCGGSLINKDWVLSAAHCFQGVSSSASYMSVTLGCQTLSGSNPNAVTKTVSQVITHSGYNANTESNDIALLKLSSSVTFTNYIRPVCLAGSGSTIDAGAMTWITGWGTLHAGDSSLPNKLQEVQIPIVSNTACNKAYSGYITNNMLCAGVTSGGKDSCQGDSGGPMVYKNDSLWIQSGIVSFGRSCAQADYPGVYTRVSQYQGWINNYISSSQPGFVQFAASGGSSNLHHYLPHTFFILLYLFL
ncbi:trypsin I-P1-like [Paramisgurnus dabryanus]|uniref:trypsin I-P1-like n=1 Tax=Paramisgurnus dabryanus TaxID=90735 RepID=UPI0031F35CCD